MSVNSRVLFALAVIAAFVAIGAVSSCNPAGAQAIPYPKTGPCASGYMESGGFCTPSSRNTRRSFPKGKGACPSGYAQSGSACQEIR